MTLKPIGAQDGEAADTITAHRPLFFTDLLGPREIPGVPVVVPLTTIPGPSRGIAVDSKS
jgi:hypothetical protein